MLQCSRIRGDACPLSAANAAVAPIALLFFSLHRSSEEAVGKCIDERQVYGEARATNEAGGRRKHLRVPTNAPALQIAYEAVLASR